MASAVVVIGEEARSAEGVVSGAVEASVTFSISDIIRTRCYRVDVKEEVMNTNCYLYLSDKIEVAKINK